MPHQSFLLSGAAVACIRLPELPIRVEVLRHPAWDGRPLVLAGGPGEQQVVRLCTPEAERAGIHPGLPLREVLALSQDAIVVQHDPVRVAEIMEDTLVRLQQVTPAMEVRGEEIFLDLRGLGPCYGDDLGRLEQAIRKVVPPLLRPRLGVAPGKFVAAMAARGATATGLRVVTTAETVAFLAPLSVSWLPFSAAAVQRLEALGLRTMGDLAGLPLSAVQAQLGSTGARAWRAAGGRDDDPLVARTFRPTVRIAVLLEDPLATVDAIFLAVRDLVARAFASPRMRGRAARIARLRGLLTDGGSWERSVTFRDPAGSAEGALPGLRAKLVLPNALPTAPLTELALELIELTAQWARQPGLLAVRVSEREPVVEAVGQLATRYGRVPIYNAVEVEPWSRIPERRWALVPFEP